MHVNYWGSGDGKVYAWFMDAQSQNNWIIKDRDFEAPNINNDKWKNGFWMTESNSNSWTSVKLGSLAWCGSECEGSRLIIGLFMGAHKLVLTVCQEYHNNKFSYAHAHGNYVTLIIIIKFPPTHRHMHTRTHMHPYPCDRTHTNMQINSYELGPDMNGSNPT